MIDSLLFASDSSERITGADGRGAGGADGRGAGGGALRGDAAGAGAFVFDEVEARAVLLPRGRGLRATGRSTHVSIPGGHAMRTWKWSS